MQVCGQDKVAGFWGMINMLKRLNTYQLFMTLALMLSCIAILPNAFAAESTKAT